MISPNEIKTKAERKYFSFLQSIVQAIPFSRIVILGDKTYNKTTISDFQKESLALMNQSKEKKGFGFTLDYQTIKTKTIGTQQLPTSIYFDTEKDFLKFLGKEKEVENFINDWQTINTNFLELKDWLIKNPTKIIQHQGKWESILKVCNYFKNSPKPNLYIRELPANVHTKFIESNQSIISELLDIIIQNHINLNEKEFEKRFNLKFREPLVRFKILDKNISENYFSGLNDISIPISQFESLKLPLKQVLIVENKTTLYTTLTLPKMDNTIAIFGQGNAVTNIQNAKWLDDLTVLYWGDIDAHGFEILSRIRKHFKHTKSVLMDKSTFDKYFENDSGKPTTDTTTLNLTDNEKELYNLLKTNNWRLEQEKIPFDYVNRHFDNE
ncbi:Wadjet anti-phage system protein JetD domain-containing protein [Halpernia frigidisoli]|uniref:Wadjet protein JetD C-terminal domain-containing protein n=1 Tax=Halpernia frigidisoli TaxID=1125876 RepID=A0A1I3JF92_9FLAO|nr:Wadjet anti-phage system protein JetD domain-containing protein [Halpernia frigidisoli]SFI58952.1 hypothetical protein SAMN05443292_3008 [Halpernia frigidisoli]